MPSPVAITSPMCERLIAPGPLAISSGTMATIIATVVIKMGRSRVAAPATTASIFDRPCSRCSWLENSTIRMPFLAIRPISVIKPTCV